MPLPRLSYTYWLIHFKYRKRLLKFVISRIDDNRKASEIIQEVNVLKIESNFLD